MKSIFIILCIFVVSSLGHRSSSSESSEEFKEHDGIEQLLQHYHQIDHAPFVGVAKAKENAEGAIVETVGGLVVRDRHDDAKRLYDGVKKHGLIKDVVADAYDGDLHSTIKLVEFLKKMNDKSEQMIGFSKLYDEIKKRRDMKNLAIIEVAYWLKHHLLDGEVPLQTHEFPERFLHYVTEEHSIVNEAMRRLAQKIRRGDNEEALLLSQTFPGALSAVTPKLVDAVYGNDVNNFKAVLDLANMRGLTPTHREKVLDALLTEMYQNNHLKTQMFETLKNTINASAMTTLKKKVANLLRHN